MLRRRAGRPGAGQRRGRRWTGSAGAVKLGPRQGSQSKEEEERGKEGGEKGKEEKEKRKKREENRKRKIRKEK
jgi:hypothetical protein